MTKFISSLESTYTELPEIFFSKLSPSPVSKPKIVIFNHKLAEEIDLNLTDYSSSERADLLSGNHLPAGLEPFAQAYAGHQFGNLAILGDGRAIVLGEHITPFGQRLDIQLKGSGQTPYSRGGDGRAALGPMLREYIISEAMHALGVPTTRSLAVVTTGEKVYREAELPGAILTRIASSHIRVGTFTFASLQKDKSKTQSLLDYLINRHFSEIKKKGNQALALLEAVIHQQAELITHWMRVGFIHGVMNTDNMALSGETIDYGPCAFMDSFAPETVFSSIDHNGRYAYANQPYIAQWNIARLAESLLPLIDGERGEIIEMLEDLLNSFEEIYKSKWLKMIGFKLGLSEVVKDDERLIADLLNWMHENSADYTNTFRELGKGKLPDCELYSTKNFKTWYARWQSRMEKEKGGFESCFSLMQSVNPAVIPRNHKVEEALLASENSDFTHLNKLLNSLETPYQEREDLLPYQVPPKQSEKILQTFCGT